MARYNRVRFHGTIARGLLLLALSCFASCTKERTRATDLRVYSDENIIVQDRAALSPVARRAFQAFHIRHGWKLIGPSASDSTQYEWAWTATLTVDSLAGPRSVTHSGGVIAREVNAVTIASMKYQVLDKDGFVLAESELDDEEYGSLVAQYASVKANVLVKEGEPLTFQQIGAMPRQRAPGCYVGRCIICPDDTLLARQRLARLEARNAAGRHSQAVQNLVARGMTIYSPKWNRVLAEEEEGLRSKESGPWYLYGQSKR